MTTVNQVNNTLQQAGVSISKSTIKRRLYEGKYRGFAAASRIGRLDWTSLKKKKHVKKPAQFWTNVLWTHETSTRMMEKKKNLEVWNNSHHL